MVDTVAPRRGESVVDENGIPTTRFFEYLEAVSTKTNNTSEIIDIDASTINQSIGAIAKVSNQIKELESQPELMINAALDRLQKQIDELRLLVT